jgi:hypothetical protein
MREKSPQTRFRTGLERTFPLETARARLTAEWLLLAGLIFLVLIIQSVFGKYQNKAQEVWTWALPSIMPTLTMIVSVLGVDAARAQAREVHVQKNFYTIAMVLSACYLLLILATILIEPFTSFDPLDLLKLSNLWLGPFQGLVASAVGFLFISRRSART